MIAKYWRIRFGDSAVYEIYLKDVNNINILGDATKTWVHYAATTGSYYAPNMYDGNVSTYCYYQSYQNYSNLQTYGYDFGATFTFSTPVDVRKLTINWRRNGPFIFECSKDGNVWFTMAGTTALNNATMISTDYIIPTEFSPRVARFWQLCIILHADSTSNIKIKQLRLTNPDGTTKEQFKTMWNMFFYEPSITIPSDFSNTNAFSFSTSGTVNTISSSTNITNVPVPDTTYAISGDGWGGTIWSADWNSGITGKLLNNVWGVVNATNDKTGLVGTHAGPFWNNTNMSSNLANAASACDFDGVHIIFDNSTASKPTAIALASSNAVRIGDDWANNTGAKYQPYDMFGYIRIDNFSGYMANGLTITGFSTSDVKINGVNFIPDTTPPITSISPVQRSFITVQAITLTRDEPGVTYYTLNGGPTQEYTAPFNLSEPTEVIYWTVDEAGNSESPQSAYFIIDLITPVTTPSHISGVYGSTFQLTLESSETATIKYTIDGDVEKTFLGPISINSDIGLFYYSVDTAGNVETTKRLDYVIDTVIPTVSISPAPGSYGWPISVVITSNEPGIIYYQCNGGSIIRYVSPLNYSDNAVVSIKYWAVDSAGNKSTTHTINYEIDPQYAIPSPAPGYYTEAIDITLTSTTPGTIKYKVLQGA